MHASEMFLRVRLTGEIVRGVAREEYGWVRVHRQSRRERHSWSALCSRLSCPSGILFSNHVPIPLYLKSSLSGNEPESSFIEFWSLIGD